MQCLDVIRICLVFVACSPRMDVKLTILGCWCVFLVFCFLTDEARGRGLAISQSLRSVTRSSGALLAGGYQSRQGPCCQARRRRRELDIFPSEYIRAAGVHAV